MARKKPQPREAPAGRDQNVPLTAKELAEVNKAVCGVRRDTNNVVREPPDSDFGQYKVLARVDGLGVLHDTKRLGKGDLGNGLVFWTVDGARNYAKTLVANKK